MISEELKKYDFWIARYPVDDNGTLIERYRPDIGVGWQYTSKGRIPGIEASVGTDGVLNATVTDADALRTYLTNYIFNSKSTPQVSGCPYIGSDTWLTGAYQAINGATVNYNDNGSSLSVQWKGGAVRNVVPDYEYFPFAFSDGAFHIIDGVFN